MSPSGMLDTCGRQCFAPRNFAVAAVLTVALAPAGTHAMFGGGGYNPPAPKCPAFKCGKDEKPVGRPDYKMWSYGCKDSGASFLNMASLDPNNPLGGMQKQKTVDKCCVEQDICKQTCGMTSQVCHDNFQKCSKKICKGDQNCEMQAMLAEIMNEPYEEKDYDIGKDEKYDPEKRKCKSYDRGQKDACTCVPKSDWQISTEANLKAFYKKFNPEKLDKGGEIKDLAEVWKKWKGKESDMFMALATKYKDKAVEIRVKPKPPPYKPPPKDDEESSASSVGNDFTPPEAEDSEPDTSSSEGGGDQSEASSAQSASSDAESEEFEKKKQELEDEKKKAIDDEDYDAAQKVKESMKDLTKKEVERLNVLKNKAIDDEDYLQAKRLKARLSKLDL